MTSRLASKLAYAGKVAGSWGDFRKLRTCGWKSVLARKRIGGSAVVLIGMSLASIRHMTTANLTTNDIRLRDAVMRQLAWIWKWMRAPSASPPPKAR